MLSTLVPAAGVAPKWTNPAAHAAATAMAAIATAAAASPTLDPVELARVSSPAVPDAPDVPDVPDVPEALVVPEIASRANATSLALWNRSAGFFSRQCLMIRSSAG